MNAPHEINAKQMKYCEMFLCLNINDSASVNIVTIAIEIGGRLIQYATDIPIDSKIKTLTEGSGFNLDFWW